METFPFYSQCFLMLGLCFERWIMICRPHAKNQILTTSDRLILNAVIAGLTIAVSGFVVIDYINHVLVKVSLF